MGEVGFPVLETLHNRSFLIPEHLSAFFPKAFTTWVLNLLSDSACHSAA